MLRISASAVPLIAPYAPTGHGGGGGGDRSPLLRASKGRLPKVAPRQFTPPSAVIRNPNPKLAMDPSLLISPDIPLPQTNLAGLGDPFAKIGPPSNGPGSGGGIGPGDGKGVGPGTGPGFGPGSGGNSGGGPNGFRTGALISGPVLLFKVEPEFSEEARKAKLQGVVVLYVAKSIRMAACATCALCKASALGLDEKAMEASPSMALPSPVLSRRPTGDRLRHHHRSKFPLAMIRR